MVGRAVQPGHSGVGREAMETHLGSSEVSPTPGAHLSSRTGGNSTAPSAGLRAHPNRGLRARPVEIPANKNGEARAGSGHWTSGLL